MKALLSKTADCSNEAFVLLESAKKIIERKSFDNGDVQHNEFNELRQDFLNRYYTNGKVEQLTFLITESKICSFI